MSNNLTNLTNKNTLLILNDIKKMRNLESHWQTGQVLYKEDNNKVIIRFANKKASQLFLTRDLYNNNLIYFDKNQNKLSYKTSMFFWCKNLEKNLTFKNPLYDLISHYQTYQNLFLRKKRVLFFIKFKARSKTVSDKLTKNISKIVDDNIFYNIFILKFCKNLLKILLKKRIKKRVYKTEIMMEKNKLNLFMFLLNCHFSGTKNKKKFKYLFFSKNKYFMTIGQLGPRHKTLALAKKRFQKSNKRLNFFNKIELGSKMDKNQSKYYNKLNKNINIGFLSKNDLYNNNFIYKKYFNNWFYIKKNFIS